MKRFENIRFRGAFRDYQQRVLDNADRYLKDGKINIVAAPGSGKTVLGLELIRRLGSPCIVLSPTTAIRQQWGERFKELFLDDEADFPLLFSSDLHNVKLLNSVTYQALYTAIDKISANEDGDIDCSDIDIFCVMREFGIKTVCLDEAHHLKNEWQKALEKFISALDKDVKIISLTATPPYDSEGSEWSRYMNVCGEIDEEIFVPELVGQNTLCPHQDYVYLNYPTESEIASLQDHKNRAALAVEELGKLDVFSQVCRTLNAKKDYDALFSSAKQYVALFTLLRHYGLEIDKKSIRELTAKKGLPFFKMQYAETAIQFLLDGERITDEQKTEIISVLKKNSVYEKKKVTLVLNERLKRTLISSVGKLESIQKIANGEVAAMGQRLRMLILTDYIKKENLAKIASAEEFNSVNIVSIFETIRRANLNVNIGVLSGSLVILPKSIDLSDIKHKKEDIADTDYCTIEFAGALHRGVDYVGKLFEEGKIQILIGTKSLLGEGWDSPCINSLILASFVGSFVLSNQMRGRAIRIDKNDPEKSANIWHLVTVEPEYLFKDKATERISAYLEEDYKELHSYDYDILKRRFDSFMGPNYSTGVIESGIERITAIKPPYDKNGIERINEEMLKLSADRGEVKNKWRGEVSDGSFAVGVETEIPKEKRIPVFTFWNFALNAILVSTEISLLRPLMRLIANNNVPMTLGTLAAMIGLFVVLYHGIKKMVLHSNPANSIKTLGVAVYKTLCECDLISPSAKVETTAYKQIYIVSLHLRNASIHDQNIFNTAMTEMLSPIENPRYILISKNIFKRYNYELSFACPSIIGKKKEYVEVLAEKLKATTGSFEPVYTHREDGRRLILKCRKRSYITFNEKAMGKKYKVSHWE
ncbi:MAG: DEAD/DEAH box helicase family protein [Clostridia bacterium]|nr:DEAD/DEAH box helicase family protein [Clostridia bacterium]